MKNKRDCGKKQERNSLEQRIGISELGGKSLRLRQREVSGDISSHVREYTIVCRTRLWSHRSARDVMSSIDQIR
jgi:hypothetical protein